MAHRLTVNRLDNNNNNVSSFRFATMSGLTGLEDLSAGSPSPFAADSFTRARHFVEKLSNTII
jgi:hypothetical protein